MSYREAWVLMNHLPQESWTQTILRDRPATELAEMPVSAQAGPRKFGPWSQEHYLTASLIDAVRRVEYVLRRVNGDEKFPFPEPVARPGMERPVRRQNDAQVAYLRKLRATG